MREYIAQRRQIDQLLAQSAQTQAQLARLQAEAARLNDPAYIEQQARDRLHFCLPRQTCYVIVGGQPAHNAGAAAAAVAAPVVRAAVVVRPAGRPQPRSR